MNGYNLRSQLIKGGFTNYLIQVGFAGLSLASLMILARLLGANGYGAFANATAWVNIFVAFATFGFGTLLVRDVAVLQAKHEWTTLHGVLRFSDRFVLGLSALLVIVFIVMARFIYYKPGENSLLQIMWIAAPLIPLWAIASLRQSAIRGLEQTSRAMLPDLIIRPALVLVGIFVVFYGFPGSLNASVAMAVSVGGSIIALAVGIVWLQKFLPKEVHQSRPEYEAKTWLTSALPLFILGGMQSIISQTPTVILGVSSSIENAGLYAVAIRLASVMIYLPSAIGIIIGPMMARLYANNEKDRVQNLLTQTTRVSFIINLLTSLVLFVFGKIILSFFGPEYVAAQLGLYLLVIGNLVDNALGNSIILLAMTGYERIVATIIIISAFTNVVLNFLLIPSYGFTGAALVSAIIMIVSRCVFAFVAKKKVGVNTTIFSGLCAHAFSSRL